MPANSALALFGQAAMLLISTRIAATTDNPSSRAIPPIRWLPACPAFPQPTHILRDVNTANKGTSEMRFTILLAVVGCVCLLQAGCRTDTYADRGALAGGLIGTGTGALVGNAVGNTTAGAAIGAGVGALSGAAIGSSLDEIEARNRARISQQMGQEIQPGKVTYDEVVAMTSAGVDEELIVRHIEINGMVRPLSTDDLITLQQSGVSSRVIKAMQTPPKREVTAEPPRERIIVRESTPPPVVIHEYGPPVWWGPRYYHHRRYHPPRRPGVVFGMTIHD